MTGQLVWPWAQLTNATPPGNAQGVNDFSRLVGWLQSAAILREPTLAASNQLVEEVRLSARALGRPASSGPGVLDSNFHWKVSGSSGWRRKFYTALANPPNQTGELTVSALRRSVADSVQVRLLRIGDANDHQARWLGSIKMPDGLYLLVPGHGVQKFSVGRRGHRATAETDFGTFMSQQFAAEADKPFYSYVVPIPTLLHTTWIGPLQTAANSKPVRGGQFRLLPDVGGPILLSRAVRNTNAANAANRWTDTVRPIRIIFHCLRANQPQFAQTLDNHGIRAWAVEDQLPAPGQNLPSPLLDVNHIPVTVEQIIRRSVMMNQQAQTSREAVNAKNVWSLYAIWRYSGYHVDTGIFPRRTNRRGHLRRGTTITLPEPGDLVVPNKVAPQAAHLAGANGTPARRILVDVPYPNGYLNGHQVAVSTTGVLTTSMILPLRNQGPLASRQPRHVNDLVVQDEQSQPTDWRGDVWLLGSDRGNDSTLRALRFYTQLWYLIQGLRGTNQGGNPTFDGHSDANRQLYRDSCRQIIVSAALTGLAPSDPRQLMADHSLGTLVGNRSVAFDMIVGGADIPSLGLEKTFFGTHG